MRSSTETSEIAIFNGSAFAELDLTGKFDLPVGGFEQLRVDADGTPWFVTHHSLWSGVSLCSYSDGEIRRFNTNAPLSFDFKDIHISGENVWLTSSLGVSRFDGGEWENTVFNTDSDFVTIIGLNGTTEVLEDDRGRLYFIAEDGIRILDGGVWSFISTKDNDVLTYDTNFIDAAFDENGVMWLATYGALVTFDGETWTRDTFPADSDHPIFKLVVDKNNSAWCTSNDCILKFDGAEWTVITMEDLGREGSVFNAAVDMYNVVWFNCSGGLFSYDGTGFTWYDGLTCRFYASGFNMGVDERDRIWTINTKYLSVYDGLSWNVYDIGSIQQPKWTGQFTVDSYDRLWIADMESVRCYNLSGFPKVAPTAVEDDIAVPSAIELTGNYPNPFNPSTTIEFTIPEAGFTELTVYNAMGQKVCDLVSHTLTAGKHSVVWDGRDTRGLTVSSGIYISKLKRGDNTVSRRMMLVK